MHATSMWWFQGPRTPLSKEAPLNLNSFCQKNIPWQLPKCDSWPKSTTPMWTSWVEYAWTSWKVSYPDSQLSLVTVMSWLKVWVLPPPFPFSLTDKWSPALQIRTVLLSIQALLSAPNPDDPLANDVAEQWKSNEAQAIETGETARTHVMLSEPSLNSHPLAF